MNTKKVVGYSALGVGAIGLAWWLWPSEKHIRNSIVAAAEGEHGSAPDTAKYWQAALGHSDPHPPDWCGAFSLWALKRAGLAHDTKWEVGKGFLYKLPTTSVPKPGDIAYFEHNQHHALVKEVHPDGQVSLINGNGQGGHVTLTKGPREHVTAFYSVAPLIRNKR